MTRIRSGLRRWHGRPAGRLPRAAIGAGSGRAGGAGDRRQLVADVLGCVAVWAIVLLLLLLALRRRRRAPLRRPHRLIVVGGLVLPTVALTALLVHGSLGSARVTATAWPSMP